MRHRYIRKPRLHGERFEHDGRTIDVIRTDTRRWELFTSDLELSDVPGANGTTYHYALKLAKRLLREAADPDPS